MKMKIISTIISVSALSLALTGNALAAGTAAGTAVDNTASITYDVGTVTQAAIGSSPTGNSSGAGTPTSFVVDKKIDLLVTGPGSALTVTPGSTDTTPNNLTFTVTNEGNSTENFKLTDGNVATGDNFDISGCTIASSAPAVAATTGPIVVELAADATSTITVSCDVPLTPTNTQTSLVDLKAEAVTDASGATTYDGSETDTSGCSGAVTEDCTIDTVLADGTGTATDNADRNATHSATGTYVVSTADLVVTKTQSVTNMSLDLDDSGTTAGNTDVTTDTRHIPGSTIVYSITVSNAASAATATDIVLTDAVPATLTLVGTPTIAITGGDGGVASVTSGTSNSVTTAGFALDAGETATLTITATVN